MKKALLSLAMLMASGAALTVSAQTCGVSAVYGGGPFYQDPTVTVPELRASGFTTAVIWTIHIDTAGNFNYNAEFPIVANGQYIGHNTHPDFPANVALLKTAPTSITRIEAGLSAAGGGTFTNIKNLIAAHGTGATTNLYKNFKALKDSIPQIDAINFDDEVTYDVNSSVQFAGMLAAIGYKVTLCPYTNATYWKSVASQTNAQHPGTVDAVFLQCYDGGAGNNPCSSTWDFGGIPVYPGLWDRNYTPSGVQTKMTTWKTSCGINGGFMWLYDDFKNTVKSQQYASAINVAARVPSAVGGASPADSAAIGALQTTTLKWNSALCATSYDVYFGTSNPPALVGNQTDTFYHTPALSPNTTYYWRVDPKNSLGNTTGKVRRFSTNTTSIIGQTIAGFNTGNAYPNPFNDYTSLDLTIPAQATAALSVVDLYGHEVYAVPTINPGAGGRYTFTWRGESAGGQRLASGIYFIRVTATDKQGRMAVENRKVVLVR